MNLLSFFGIDAQLHRLRTAVGEGALALEDRFQLARLEWEEEKSRLKLLLAFALALLGLTVVALTIASFAIVVQFWDSPDRAKAAWIVAGVWLALWAGLGLGIVSLLRRGTEAFGPTREELGKDWDLLRADIVPGGRKASPRRSETRPVDKDALLARITRQRERLARQQPAAVAHPPVVVQKAVPGTVASSVISSADPAFPRSATMRAVRDNPVASIAAVGVAAAVVTAMGPRRVARIASWVLPLVLPRR